MPHSELQSRLSRANLQPRLRVLYILKLLELLLPGAPPYLGGRASQVAMSWNIRALLKCWVPITSLSR